MQDLNMNYFNYVTGFTMTNSKFHMLFGGPPRKAESAITQKEMDIARSIQVVTEGILLKLAKTIHHETQAEYLCLAGGVALNCVANGRLMKESPFKDIWIQPAAGDAGGALGAAMLTWHEHLKKARNANNIDDKMRGAYLGGSFSNKEIIHYLDSIHAPYENLDDTILIPQITELLNQGCVIGWFNGRMEFGPRALGARSIIGDPRNTKMQSIMNLKIKYRESFRPFAPAIKADKVQDWFSMHHKSPYMLLVAQINDKKRLPMSTLQQSLFGIDKLNVPRSGIPAVTHVDYSARVQTVHKETNPRFYNLIDSFEKKTNCPVLINTSFNVRGEPIVYTPKDAYRCFMRTEIDYLVMENVILDKKQQPKWDELKDWKKEFELD